MATVVNIGKARLTVAVDGRTSEGRTVYRYTVCTPSGANYSNNDLRSGCQGGDQQEGMFSLLAFLSACAESYPDGENADMFPIGIAEWAAANQDEIDSMQCRLEEAYVGR